MKINKKQKDNIAKMNNKQKETEGESNPVTCEVSSLRGGLSGPLNKAKTEPMITSPHTETAVPSTS